MKRAAAMTLAVARESAAAIKGAAAMRGETGLAMALIILGAVVTTSLLFAVR